MPGPSKQSRRISSANSAFDRHERHDSGHEARNKHRRRNAGRTSSDLTRAARSGYEQCDQHARRQDQESDDQSGSFRSAHWGKVLERLATSAETTIVIEKQPGGKMRVTSGSWDGEKVLSNDQALENRVTLASTVCRKTRKWSLNYPPGELATAPWRAALRSPAVR